MRKPTKKPMKRPTRLRRAIPATVPTSTAVSAATVPIAVVAPSVVSLMTEVLELHAKVTNMSGQSFCEAGCRGPWPCQTVRLLNR